MRLFFEKSVKGCAIENGARAGMGNLCKGGEDVPKENIVIDQRTGEVLRMARQRRPTGREFVKIQDAAMELLMQKDIKAGEMRVLLCLLLHTGYNTTRVSFDNGKPLRIDRLAKEVGMKERTCDNLLYGLQKHGIIHLMRRKNVREIKINPYFASRGKYISDSEKQEFSESAFNPDAEGGKGDELMQ